MQTEDHPSSLEITVGERGEIAIPSALLGRFGIAAGTRIRLIIDGDPPRIVLVPVTREYLHGFRGILKHTPDAEALQRRRKVETYRGTTPRKGTRHGGKRRPR